MAPTIRGLVLPSICRGCEHSAIRPPALQENLGHCSRPDAGSHEIKTMRRDGNKWSSAYCRRQWSLVDNEALRYQQLNAFDAAVQQLDERYSVLSSPHLLVSQTGAGKEDPPQVRAAAALGSTQDVGIWGLKGCAGLWGLKDCACLLPNSMKCGSEEGAPA